jgi:hypothetical protein
MFTFLPHVHFPPVAFPAGACSPRHLYDTIALLFTTVRWHMHTLILFTYTDYKTIFIPVVSLAHALSLAPPLLTVVDHVRSSRCTCALTATPPERVRMDMAPPPPVQRVQSIQDARRRYGYPGVAPYTFWTRLFRRGILPPCLSDTRVPGSIVVARLGRLHNQRGANEHHDHVRRDRLCRALVWQEPVQRVWVPDIRDWRDKNHGWVARLLSGGGSFLSL